MPNLKWTFVLALLLGFAGMLIVASRQPTPGPADMAKLSGDVWIAAQRTPEQLAGLRSQGFRTVIDLRPDGEVGGQPSSSEMAKAAQASGLSFSYVPIPHGDIPPASVNQLASLLATSERPVLLYCHSGRRAARTWALAEAARPGGLDAAAILADVRKAGQSADDLDREIVLRTGARAGAH